MGKVTEKENSTSDLQEVLRTFVKSNTGMIFQVLKHDKDPKYCFLRYRNKQIRKTVLSIKQGLVDGKYSSINEHEYRKWIAEDEKFMDELTKKIVKRIILAQLLIELDDELIEDHEDRPYFKKALEKSNKEAIRLCDKHYSKLYNADKDIFINLMNDIDNFTTNIGRLALGEFPVINAIYQKYIEDPDQFEIDTVTYTKQL